MSEKAEKLKALGSLSALIAGFAMVVQTEVTIPNDVSDYIYQVNVRSLSYYLVC